MKPPIERFEEFHTLNPHIYTQLRDLSMRVKKAGYTKFGIRQIWERLRWDSQVEAADFNSIYKLNDHYTPYYADLLMKQEPELRGFFSIRRSRREEVA